MNEKKVLILGATGLVGGALVEEFKKDEKYEVHGTYHKVYSPGEYNHWECDITDFTQVRRLVEKVSPAIIINATAFANVDKCETDKDLCWAVNVRGLQNLLHISSTSYIVHFSTDYVFDGTKDVYAEQSVPNPINYYGIAKLCGELLLLGRKNSLIVRTTGVFGWELQKKNFVYKVLNTVGKKQELKVPIDQIGCPTYAPNLAEVVKGLVGKEIHGLVHVNGATKFDRVEFAAEICNVFGLDKSLIKLVTTAELGQLAKRPLKGGLKAEYVKALLPEIKVLTAIEGLKEMKEDLMRRGEYATTETT